MQAMRMKVAPDTVAYADGEHLYALLYHEKNSRLPGDMVSNPSLIVYNLKVEGQ